MRHKVNTMPLTIEFLVFSVDGTPKPKPRMTQKDKFSPSKAVKEYWAWKKIVQIAARQEMLGPGLVEPLKGPIKVAANFRIPIPKSWSKRKKRAALALEILPIGHGSGDYDNYLKGVKDAMNKLVYDDDAQIIGVGAGYMYYSDSPGCSVTVEIIEA